MQTYKKQKNRYQLCLFLFLFSNDLDVKNNTEIIENHSEVSGCANSCKKFTFIKTHLCPRCPRYEKSVGLLPPSCTLVPASLYATYI